MLPTAIEAQGTSYLGLEDERGRGGVASVEPRPADHKEAAVGGYARKACERHGQVLLEAPLRPLRCLCASAPQGLTVAAASWTKGKAWCDCAWGTSARRRA